MKASCCGPERSGYTGSAQAEIRVDCFAEAAAGETHTYAYTGGALSTETIAGRLAGNTVLERQWADGSGANRRGQADGFDLKIGIVTRQSVAMKRHSFVMHLLTINGP